MGNFTNIYNPYMRYRF